jgi:hypothetical protein
MPLLFSTTDTNNTDSMVVEHDPFNTQPSGRCEETSLSPRMKGSYTTHPRLEPRPIYQAPNPCQGVEQHLLYCYQSFVRNVELKIPTLLSIVPHPLVCNTLGYHQSAASTDDAFSHPKVSHRGASSFLIGTPAAPAACTGTHSFLEHTGIG